MAGIAIHTFYDCRNPLYINPQHIVGISMGENLERTCLALSNQRYIYIDGSVESVKGLLEAGLDDTTGAHSNC